MRRARRLLAVLAASLALAGCTLVAPNPHPQAIAKSQLKPFGLLSPTIPGTNGARVRFITQPIYIVDAAHSLAPSSRIVPSPPSLQTVIEQLLLGPTAIERSAGYSSALPKKLVLISATLHDHVGYVDLATSLSSLSTQEQLLAVGQIVLTATAVGATEGVVLEAAGVRQSILLPDGRRTTRARAVDFLTLLNA